MITVTVALVFTGLVVLLVGLGWGFFKDSPAAPSLGPVIVILLGLATVVAGFWVGVA